MYSEGACGSPAISAASGRSRRRDRLREVGLGGGLNAHRGAAVGGPVRGSVQVLREDLRLRVLLLVLLRPGRLADLPLDRLLRIGDVEVADQLLGDRRAALDRSAGLQVLPAGAHDRPVVDPAVLVEVLVLDRHRRVVEHLGDLLGGHRVPDRVRLDVAQAAAVGSEDDRVGALLDGLQLVERGSVGSNAQHPDADPSHGDGDQGDQDAERHQELSVHRPPRATVPLAPSLSHSPVAKRVAGSGSPTRRTAARAGPPCAAPRGRSREAPPPRRPPGCARGRAAP